MERPQCTEWLLPMVLGAAFVACSDAPTASPKGADAAPASAPPNILVITIDTLRADHLGCYGYDRATSPNLDALAAESIVFENTQAPVATTLPSHTSMFTGVYPHEHGVLANIADGKTYRRAPSLITLAQYLSDVGYTTSAAVSAFPLSAEFGLDTGFDTYDESKRKQRGAKAATRAALAAAEAWTADGPPQFLWVHYFDPHVPYHPPPDFRDRFQMSDAEKQAWLDRGYTDRSERRTGEWNELAEGMDLYDEEIAFVDSQIGRLLGELESSGWLPGAVIAVVADHGEGLNQHGMPGHGYIWREQLHVPMILHAPGEAPRRIDAPSSLVDFTPTLLHVVDLPNEDRILGQASGINRLDPSIVHEDSRVFGQSSPLQSVNDALEYTVEAAGWRLHLRPGGARSLYELSTDPGERNDVAGQQTGVADRLEQELRAFLDATQRETITEEASDAVRDDLRALGYGGAPR